MRLPTPRQRQSQRFLGSGLADGAGDRDDLCTCARTRCPRQVAQTFEDVGNDDERRTVGKVPALVGGNNCKAGAGFERGRNEIVAIAVVPFDGEERLAGRNRTRVDGKTHDRARQCIRIGRAHRAKHRLDGPERPIDHATLPASAAATASWSLNGNTCLPMIWPVSWPLPAIKSTSPRRRSAIER